MNSGASQEAQQMDRTQTVASEVVAMARAVDSMNALELDLMQQALEDRRRQLRSETASSLRPGDKVRLHGIRPKYLNGRVVTVGHVNVKTITVQDPAEVGSRFANSRTVRIPIKCVERVDA
jgi:hypothetical protein